MTEASLEQAVRAFEREYVSRAIARARGKRVRAAEMLGISRKSLWEKMRLHGIAAPRSEFRDQPVDDPRSRARNTPTLVPGIAGRLTVTLFEVLPWGVSEFIAVTVMV